MYCHLIPTQEGTPPLLSVLQHINQVRASITAETLSITKYCTVFFYKLKSVISIVCSIINFSSLTSPPPPKENKQNKTKNKKLSIVCCWSFLFLDFIVVYLSLWCTIFSFLFKPEGLLTVIGLSCSNFVSFFLFVSL